MKPMLQRTFDVDKIMGVYQHPAIWGAIGGNEVDNFSPPMSNNDHYLHAPGAIFYIHPEGSDWMIHVNVVPEARSRAYEMGQEALRYTFETLGADKIVAEIPMEFDNVYQFALKYGCEVVDFCDGDYKLELRYSKWVQ